MSLKPHIINCETVMIYNLCAELQQRNLKTQHFIDISLIRVFVFKIMCLCNQQARKAQSSAFCTKGH